MWWSRLSEQCQISDSRSHFQYNELIFDPQVGDGGSYTCKVSNVAGQVDRTFRLTVHGTEAALLCFLLRMYSSATICSAFHTLISTHMDSSTSPGRFTLGVLKPHSGLTRGLAMPGLGIPCADYHLAERWNSYWSVLTTVLINISTCRYIHTGYQYKILIDLDCKIFIVFWKARLIKRYPQRAACSGSGLSEGAGWSWGPSPWLMVGFTPVWPRTVRDKHRRTTHSQCKVKTD